jgi:hypothetical protein
VLTADGVQHEPAPSARASEVLDGMSQVRALDHAWPRHEQDQVGVLRQRRGLGHEGRRAVDPSDLPTQLRKDP